MDAAGPTPAAADEPTGAGQTPGRLAERMSQMPDDPDREARWAAWRIENAEAIASSNAWVEKHGLPLAKYRMF